MTNFETALYHNGFKLALRLCMLDTTTRARKATKSPNYL